MSSINFVNPYLLFIAIPLVALIAVPSAIAIRKGNRNAHNITSIVIHLVMAVLIAFSAAGLSVLTVETETNVYVLADISYSADRNLDTVDSYISELSRNLPQNSKMGLITFGRNCEVLARPGEKIKSVKTSIADNTETNIASALEFTGRQFGQNEGVIKRIVLITDGRQTDTRDSNAVKRAVDALAEQDIKVDAIYLDDNVDADTKEVQLSGAEFTRSAYLNRQEKVEVTLRSSFITKADVYLYKNGELFKSKEDCPVDIGYNTVDFDLDTTVKGTFNYEIRIEADGDTSSLNNVYTFTQQVADIVNVLVISSSASDINAAKQLYGDDTNITSYNVTTNANVPCTIEALCVYDEIILSGVDITKINNYSLFIENLDAAVSLCGKSLITIGDMGIQTFRDDITADRALEKLGNMLPVNYGNNDEDRKLYAIVLDASSSMLQLDKFTRAKTAAINLLKQINDEDSVVVLGFNGNLTYRKGPVKASGRDAIIEEIQNTDLGNGTLMGFGLKSAYDILVKYDVYDVMQVMLISDGLDNSIGSDNDDDLSLEPKAVASQMYMDAIVTSVIDIGRAATSSDADNYEETMAAEKLLKDIARNGGGEYYLGDTDEKLQDVLFSDIAGDISQTVVEQNSAINVNRRSNEVVADIEFPSNTFISKFVNSSTRTEAGAVEVLSVSYTKNGGRKITAPLYSTWNYRNGKVSSFTSGLSEDAWVRGFKAQKEQYTRFFQNVVSTNIPAEKNDCPFNIEVIRNGTFVRVELNPVSLHADTNARISVVRPDGPVSGALRTQGAKFYYEFEASKVGKYEIKLNYSYGDNEYETTYFYDLAFAPEYDTFASFDPAGLQKAVGGNGTVSLDGKLKIVNDDSEVQAYTKSLAVPLLITCAVLFVVDIAIRKLKWEDIVSLFKKVK